MVLLFIQEKIQKKIMAFSSLKNQLNYLSLALNSKDAIQLVGLFLIIQLYSHLSFIFCICLHLICILLHQ